MLRNDIKCVELRAIRHVVTVSLLKYPVPTDKSRRIDLPLNSTRPFMSPDCPNFTKKQTSGSGGFRHGGRRVCVARVEGGRVATQLGLQSLRGVLSRQTAPCGAASNGRGGGAGAAGVPVEI